MRTSLALILAIALVTIIRGAPIVDLIVLPFLVTLLASHIDRNSREIGLTLVRAASTAVPKAQRLDHHDEWVDHVCAAGEHGVAPLTRALSIALIAAPALAVGLRVGRRRRAIG